jgi:lipoate-protein ligase A
MLVILRTSTDPWFNIATEEYLICNFDQDTFSLWRNEASVIVGKHQNAVAEINHSLIRLKNIPVIRRISGGGTVYHDPGNINFTFTRSISGNDFINYRKYARPVLNVLKKAGVKAKFEGKSDLSANGKKISGNSMHIRKSRLLQHGTLLYSTDLDMLGNVLMTDPEKYSGKAVDSVRRQVVNIGSLMVNPPDADEFMMILHGFFLDSLPHPEIYEFTVEDIRKINELVEKKYTTWEWNYGYSPAYSVAISIAPEGSAALGLIVEVKNGFISNVDSEGGVFPAELPGALKQSLTGLPHRYDAISKALDVPEIRKFFATLDVEELTDKFF